MAAAVRELREETALTLADVDFREAPFTSTDAVNWVAGPGGGVGSGGAVRYHYVISQCLAQARDPDAARAKAEAGDDAAALGWFTMEEMRRLSPAVLPLMLRVVEQAEALV